MFMLKTAIKMEVGMPEGIYHQLRGIRLYAVRFLQGVMCCFRCGSGWRLSCIWLRDGSHVRTCLGRRTNYCCYLCIIYSDIGNVM